jgi:hypothetical protein
MRAINFFLLCTSFIALILVYGQKNRTEHVQSQVIELQNEIASKEQLLNRLDADWAFLNQPGRLQAIVERHAETLQLAPTKVEQFGSIDQLPMRPAQPDVDALDALILSLGEGVDPNDQEGLSVND